MTDGMSLGRQQAGQLTGTLTGPPERGHGIAAGIRVNQSFQRLDQLGVVLDQRLPSSSRVPYSLNGERWLSKAVDSPIDGRTRESAKAVRKNYFSNLDDDDGAKWSSSNPARPSEA